MKIKESAKDDIRLNEDIIWAVSKTTGLTREEVKDLCVEEGLTRFFRKKVIDEKDPINLLSLHIIKNYLEDENE